MKKTFNKERMLGILLIASAFLTYIAITTSRLLYNSEKLTLIEENIVTLTDAANVYNVFTITYAVAQIALAFVMKRLNLKRYIFFTIVGSALVTSFMMFADELVSHYVIFAMMGILQAGYWSSNLKLLSVYLPSSMLPAASAVMTTGPAIAGALSFGVAALFGSDWRTPFLTMGILTVLSVVLYTLSLSSLDHVREANMKLGSQKKEDEHLLPDTYSYFETKWGVLIFYAFSILVGCSLISIYCIIGNNLDVYLSMVGEMDTETVKTIMIVMPLIAAVGPFMTVRSTENRRGDFILVIAEYVAPSLIFVSVGFALFRTCIVPTFILFLIFYVLIHGSRSIILSVAPLKMRQKLDTGVYSIVVNASSSVASGIVPIFAARILENNEIETGFSKVFLWMLIWTAAVLAIVIAMSIFIRTRMKKHALSKESAS